MNIQWSISHHTWSYTGKQIEYRHAYTLAIISETGSIWVQAFGTN